MAARKCFTERLWVADTDRVTAGYVMPRCAWNYFQHGSLPRERDNLVVLRHYG